MPGIPPLGIPDEKRVGPFQCDRCDMPCDDSGLLLSITVKFKNPIQRILCPQCREAFRWWMGETTVGGTRVPRLPVSTP